MKNLKKTTEELPQRLPALKQAVFFAEIGSTNDQALDLGRSGGEGPALIVAGSQSAGRGRQGRHWESPPGQGLYFSLLLKPELSPKEATMLTLAGGLAIQESLHSLGAEKALLKWPNDIFIQGKKVGGVLSEMDSRSESVDFVVLGVGINVTQSQGDFPEEIKDIAGSLASTTGKTWDPSDLLPPLVTAILEEANKLEQEGSVQLLNRWEEESDFIGKKVKAQMASGSATGTVAGLSPEGYLRLKLDEGKEVTLISEETTLV
ncbi:MAG: biotin--[acetyl-CoA-carboxylase] ligase [bacterium]|nr:biotin--[acetyl-CoA-carboxylase] ligase [bacterium]